MRHKMLIKQADACKCHSQESGKQSKHLGNFSCKVKLPSLVTEGFLALAHERLNKPMEQHINKRTHQIPNYVSFVRIEE